MSQTFPSMIPIRQKFDAPPPVRINDTLAAGFASAGVLEKIQPGWRVAITVGSRGISNLREIVSETVRIVRAAGAAPFLIPSMGSHGGATPEGQTAVLAEYGITPDSMGIPIHASMEVRQIGQTADGVPVNFSSEALAADGVIILNRIKPHTDFSGNIGSGLLKMLVIGLGKHVGAAQAHLAAGTRGYEPVIRNIASVSLRTVPVLCGIAIVENQFHQTARIDVVRPADFITREEELFRLSQRLMPSLPIREVDLLIVDRIGKNISGAGIDPNIIGRSVHGYSSFLGEKSQFPVTIRRIFVRDMTPETHGNAIGIGLADLTTSRLVSAMNKNATYVNALTALTPNGAKIPIHFDTDREAITAALASLGQANPATSRVIRIADTLSLEHLELSIAARDGIPPDVTWTDRGPAEPMAFDTSGNLPPMRVDN
jgi:hypothetical protein